MRAAQDAQARNRSSPIINESIAELVETGRAYGLHPIRYQYGSGFHGRRACDGVGELPSADRDLRKCSTNIFALVEQVVPLTEDTPGPTLMNPSAAARRAVLRGAFCAIRAQSGQNPAIVLAHTGAVHPQTGWMPWSRHRFTTLRKSHNRLSGRLCEQSRLFITHARIYPKAQSLRDFPLPRS
jgi:hypothetical protein